MTTEALAPPVTGAPYTVGDLIAVQDSTGVFRAARVMEIVHVDKQQHARGPFFGLAWMIRANVRVPSAQWGVERFVYCDDNGQNRTRGSQVRPYGFEANPLPLED